MFHNYTKLYFTDHIGKDHTPLQICFIWVYHNLQKVKSLVTGWVLIGGWVPERKSLDIFMN